ncbi:MAG: HypC/HybG/HupF family hydrogenase formation chaperone [Candidatus Marinimicrobia bacterium]|nr:HypC/HybG/HupF family hydrogenase formation chaperone [Candidatus Neomarinimicrobiota bacterium]
MCLAIPGKVIETYDENGIKMGKIEYSGTISTACLEYLPEIEVGQYTLVHAGFALSVLDEEEAQKSLDAWKELGEALDEIEDKS